MTTEFTARSGAAAPAPTQSLPAASPLRGILLLVASTVFFSVSDVITKQLAATLPAGQVAWMRYAVFALLVIPLLGMNGGGTLLRSHRPGLQVLRGLGMVGSTIMFTHGLRFLPVADATAIYFVSPILIMALSILFLGEQVGWRRWTAAAVGLVGVLIVIRPGTGSFQTAALLPLAGATSWAAAAVVTRRMSGSDHALTTLAYSAFIGFAVLSAALPWSWEMPDGGEMALGLCVGLLSTVGHWFVIQAYRHGSASIIAPFSYVQLIWAGSLGYLVFGSLPDGWTIVGAGIIAASGLYTAYRERVRSLQKATA
ncbi:DMT family transporter [Microvirga roseola]|uniref:DMT family transporter n=1 Tax=Microvirga roseola TaxID=2883126 RepID=UPI001E42CA76|nr:DMT family transporter [Microvirga roseola]